ncbi:MAG: DUF3842 family protein [Clostridia bacterium]|nr:DUF3842 family protein [Clostridia bacterium]
MNVVIIDGQGGQLGAQLIKEILSRLPDVGLTAVGTNASATSAMIKAGAKKAATGENPVVVACRRADVIIGPIGIVIADSMLGEVTEKMASAVSKADSVRILIPVNKCENLVAGISNPNIGLLISDAVSKLQSLSV